MCLVGVTGVVRASTPTAQRRFTEWIEADVFARLHQTMLDLLDSAWAIDWSRASVDGMQVLAVKGGSGRAQPGRSGQARLQDPRGQ